jgi:hypothetical protein
MRRRRAISALTSFIASVSAASTRRSRATKASNSAARAASSRARFSASAGMTSAGSTPGFIQRAMSWRIHRCASWRIQRASNGTPLRVNWVMGECFHRAGRARRNATPARSRPGNGLI